MEVLLTYMVTLKNNHDTFYLVSTKFAISRFQHDAMVFINYHEALVIASKAEQTINTYVKNNEEFLGTVEPMDLLCLCV